MSNIQHDLGWRVRTLRQRHGLSIVDVSERAGLAPSYLSRLERNAMLHSKPKLDTVEKVLDAIGVSEEERLAVFNVETIPLSRHEIETNVREVAAQQEDDSQPVQILDGRWFIWYLNRAARAALGLSAADYKHLVGTHALVALVDPVNPFFSRIPSAERSALFAAQAYIFRKVFAAQEFDSWYTEITGSLSRLPLAAEIWKQPRPTEPPLVLERNNISILNPLTGYLRFTCQKNHLASNPHFLVVDWSMTSTATAIQLTILRTRPEFAYTFEAALRTPQEGMYEYAEPALF